MPRSDEHLDEGDVDPDPYEQFSRWYSAAVSAGEPEPEAMTVATADASGAPSVRWVLLKSFDGRGFVFHTNYRSPKGLALAGNPRAAVAFRWVALHRQVRASGPAGPIGPEESDAYFASRSRGSQLGAWASEQSAVIDGRPTLERALAEVSARFAGGPVARPPWWGGIRIAADTLEFWQGRADRLHDRMRYRHHAGGWVIERLSP